MKYLSAGTIMAVLFMAATPVNAAVLPSYDLDEIIIRANRPQAVVATDSINAKYVNPGKAATIPELLRQTTGIDIQQRTSMGDNQDSTVKLRGFDARRYTVLLDGRQINAAGVMGGQYVDWNTIPLDTVDKIQIIKGGKTAGYGNTIGGTINIITKGNAVGGQVSLLVGQQGRREYRMNYGAQAGKLNLQVVANTAQADAYLRNNDYDAGQYGLRLSYEPTKHDTWRLGYNKTKAQRGYILPNRAGTPGYDPSWPDAEGESLAPSIGGFQGFGDGSYWQKDNQYYDFSYKRTYESGSWQLDYYKNAEQRTEVAKKDGVVTMRRVVPSDKSDYFGLKGEVLRGASTIGYGAEYKRLRYGYGHYDVVPATGGKPLSGIYPSQKIDTMGIYVDNTWQLSERWQAYVGLRYDEFKGQADADEASTMRAVKESGLSPKLNFAFKNGAHTTTYYSLNKVWRAPSMAEYYWWSQNYNNAALGNGAPNPTYHQQLKPEQGMSYEIATKHQFSDRYTTKVGVFYQDLEDYINFRHTFPFTIYNIDQAKLWGLEWENEIKIDRYNSLHINYTNQHTQKSGVAPTDHVGLAEELDYSPRHKLGLAYQYDDERWQVRYSVNYVSEQTEAYTNNKVYHIGGYAVHNLGITRALTKQSSLALYVDNLWNKAYAEQYGYPLSGRLVSMIYTHKI
ncbi:MAG: TonB-dependent receptor [Acidaminococcaceae bacterium]